VEGDITVKQLSAIETKELLVGGHQAAQDELRRVSRYQKALDGRRAMPLALVGSRLSEAAPVPIAQPEEDLRQPLAASVASAAAAHARYAIAVKAQFLAMPRSRAVDDSLQEDKIHIAREQIKEYVRSTTDPRMASVVPVKRTRITLYHAEVEAFRADYDEEQSFEASYAAMIQILVTYLALMIVEVDGYNQRAGSAYLSKPHADALSYLLSTLDKLRMEADQLMAAARARGLSDKATAIQASLEKVNSYAKTASQTLQAKGQPTFGQHS
jgi:hypothetical protein